MMQQSDCERAEKTSVRRETAGSEQEEGDEDVIFIFKGRSYEYKNATFFQF